MATPMMTSLLSANSKLPPLSPRITRRRRGSFPSNQAKISDFGRSASSFPALKKKTSSVSFQIPCSNEDNAETTNVFQESKGEAHPMIIWATELRDRFFQFINQTLKAIKNRPELFFEQIKDILLAILKLAPNSDSVSVLFPILVSAAKHHFESQKKKPRNIRRCDLVFDANVAVLYQQMVSIIQENPAYKRLEVELPNGILLYGPVGTGKATFAHCLAKETGLDFFEVSGLDYAKDGTSIKRLFNDARACSRSIIFINDIDAIAGGHLIQLQTELKNCNNDGRVVLVIAATTKTPEINNSVLYDYGLFAEQLHVDKPDEDARKRYSALRLEEFLKEEEKETIYNDIASKTPGLVWDDLKNVTEKSKRLAAGREDKQVTKDDVRKALRGVKPKIHADKDEPMAQEHVQIMAGSMGLGSTS